MLNTYTHGAYSSLVYASQCTPADLQAFEQAYEWAAPLTSDDHEVDWRIIYPS